MYPAPTIVPDPTAVMGKRFGAYIIDALIGGILMLILLLSFATRDSYATAARAESVCDTINDDPDSDYACVPADTEVFIWKETDFVLTGLVGLGFWFLNDAILTGLAGFSIGKGVVGLRVVRSDGSLCGLARSTLRWLMWIADGAPWCVPVVGLVVAPTSKGHRRVGDHVAKTFVVDKRSVGHAIRVPGIDAPYAVGAAAPWGPPQPQWGPPQPQWGPPPQPQWGPPGPQPPQWGPPAPQPPQPQWGAPPQPQWGAPPQPQWGPSANPAPSVPPAEPPPSGAGPMWAPPPGPADPTVVQPVVGAPTQPVPAVTPGAAVPGVGAPLWDDERDTYIQWDPDLERWVQWDERARRWDPI